MSEPPKASILSTWKTGNRITCYFIDLLPDELWEEKIPGYSRKTVQMLCGHLHNTRCMWIKENAKKFDVEIPDSVNRYNVSKQDLLTALEKSHRAILEVLSKALNQKKNAPGFPDVNHFMTYLVAHEAHHRGQILMAARQLGYKLNNDLTYGIWHWNKRSKEAD